MKTMRMPAYLRPGDTIGITCPSSRMDLEVARYAAGVLESWGFGVRMGVTVGSAYHNFSAPDELRLAELQEMMDDPGIAAVIFGRGGYGMVRIIDRLDFSRFRRHPKWLCGYSDITTLHLHLQACFGIPSLHAVMCSGITALTRDDDYVGSLRRALCGEPCSYPFDVHPLNRPGKAEGLLTGGNLSLLANASGTRSQPDPRGRILLIEDTGEYRYNVDRMMENLKRAGWLEGLSGLLVGSFTEARETERPFGSSEYEIILDKVKEYDYPVAFGFPSGHQPENYALKLGLPHLLEVADTCILSEPAAAAPQTARP